MSSPCWNPFPVPFREADDDPAAGAEAFFFLASTTSPMTTYTNGVRSSVHPHPVVANLNGIFPPVYLEPGINYKVRVQDALGSILYEVDEISNPAVIDEGAGGGIVVTAAQVHQVGDTVWNAAIGERSGWVRCNGRTIGSAASVATERINDDTVNLFAFLWNNFADAICPVGGGRGATAVADFGANKTIATIDMRGCGIVGADTMGAVARSLVQTQTTITTTIGSPLATVGSVAGLFNGMRVRATSVASGTRIANINAGTSITLTANATATAAGTTARFSPFVDAEIGGLFGGEAYHNQSDRELATHTHAASGSSTVNDPGHFHNVTTDAETSNQLVGRETPAGGATFDLTGGTNDSVTVTALAATNFTGITVGTTVSVTANGLASPMNIQTPAVIGTYYMKL